MKTFKYTKKWNAAFLAYCAAAVTALSPGFAIPVPPGGPITGAPTEAGVITGTTPFLASSFVADTGNFSGDLFSLVFQESAANNPLLGLTFAYQISTNDGTVPRIDAAIDGAAFFAYDFVPPVDANWSNAGDLFGFTGGGAPTNVSALVDPILGSATLFEFQPGSFADGDVSAWMFVRTDSPTYTTGVAVLGGFGSATAAILAPIPEPTTVLFGIGLFAVAGLQRRRTHAFR